MKVRKAAGFVGIYPEMLKCCGPLAKEWQRILFNNILYSEILQEAFEKSKIIAILNPGKDGSEAVHLPPISRLSVTYKALKRLVLSHLSINMCPLPEDFERY